VTGDFVNYLRKNLFEMAPAQASQIDLDTWLTKPGLPPDTPQPKSDALDKVAAVAKDWSQRKRATASIPTKGWTTQEWLHFLTALPNDLGGSRMGELDGVFHLTSSGNSEILFQWLLMAIRNGYQPAYPKLENFLETVGRRKYIRPLYQELAKTSAGKQRAENIYAKARPGYHPIAAASIDELLK
jgi:hypothetical protein